MQFYKTISQPTSLLYTCSNRSIILINSAFTVLVIYFLWTLSITSDINPDAGYYLSVAGDIEKGLIPYKDVLVFHTPLAMYIFSLAGFIKSAPDYSDYLHIVYLFEVLSCVLVFRITYFINTDRATRYLISILTLLLILSFEGIYIVLEPFVIFFALLSFYFYLLGEKNNYFLFYSGFAASICFFTKQYGLSASAAIIFCIVFVNKNQLTVRFKMLGLFCLSFLVPLSCFYIYFTIIQGIPAAEMIGKLSGHGYGYKSVLLYIIKLGRFLFLSSPYIFLLPLLFFYKTEKREIFFSLILFLFFMSLPFYFKVFKHYFILLIPFCTIAGFYLINSSITICKKKQHLNIFHIILTLSLLGFLSSTYFSIKNIYLYIDLVDRENQLQLLGEINKWVPKNSEVLLAANQAIYYINELKTPEIDKFGYVFLKNNDNPGVIEEIAQTAQYAITDDSIIERLQRKGVAVASILKDNDFVFETNIGNQIKIWKKQ